MWQRGTAHHTENLKWWVAVYKKGGRCWCDGQRRGENVLLISTGGSHRSPPTVLYGEHTAASRQRNLRLGPLSAWQQELTITPSFSFYAPTFFLGMAGFWFVLTHGLNCRHALCKLRRRYLYSEKVHYAIVLLRKSHFCLLGNLSDLCEILVLCTSSKHLP